MADRLTEKQSGKKVRDVLPEHLVAVAPVEANDTILEAAALMARQHSPLLAVLKGSTVWGDHRIATAGCRINALTLSGRIRTSTGHIGFRLIDRFADYYNGAQMVAGAQVAVAANSPFLLTRQVWQETRITLLEQLLDSRRPREVRAGAPARVRLGDGWVNGPVELFDELVRLFPPLFPTLDAEDPDAALQAGRAPSLRELRLHNGTVWRWNRPVYDVQAGCPQLRIENRVLPSGPTAVDMVANAAFYYGLVRAIVDSEPAPSSQMPFAVAERDLHRAARDGLAARLCWRGIDHPVNQLTREVLLPAAAAGLEAWGVDADDRDRYLGVIEARVRCGRTGAAWQTQVVRYLEEHGLGRIAALREMTRRYVEHSHTGAPVHEWPVP